ncbi:MAG: hypothetical protein HYS27_06205 [Deltaproteobacteria bacterium]|nr:hypothetical protein [Deltaproteobacteria bacterium]
MVAAVGAGALTAVVSLAVPAFIATADQAGLGRLNVHDQHMFWLAWVIGAAGVPTFVAPIIVGAIVSWGTRSTVASALAIAPGVGVSALGAGLIVLGGHMLNYGETSTGKVWVSPSSIAAVGAVAATGLALGIGGIALAAAGPAIFRAEGAE